MGGHDPSFDEHHLLEARFAAQFFSMATSQITLAPIVPAFLIYIGIVLSKGPVISDLMSQYWPFFACSDFHCCCRVDFRQDFPQQCCMPRAHNYKPSAFCYYLPSCFLPILHCGSTLFLHANGISARSLVHGFVPI